VTTMNIPTAPPTSSRPQDVQAEGLRHDLVDAQVQVLSIYLDKRPPEHLVTALDRLIECCRASFREEEALMARLGGQIDRAHRERHQTVMHQPQRVAPRSPGYRPWPAVGQPDPDRS
jgi:hypothetical protein